MPKRKAKVLIQLIADISSRQELDDFIKKIQERFPAPTNLKIKVDEELK